MKALSIRQPWANLILTGEKRIENRTWSTSHRGRILVHAAKSVEDLQIPDSGIRLTRRDFGFQFGALIGVVDIVDCIVMDMRYKPPALSPENRAKYPWLESDVHAIGPVCWVLENPRFFKRHIKYSGRLNLFNVPDDVVKEALRGK